MKIIHGIKNLKRQSGPSVVVVGIFDGVHIGHRKIIEQAVKQAKSLNARPVAVTFDPHPEKILRGRSAVAMLASLKHRLRILDELGIELCLVMNFSRAIARKGALEFMQQVLIRRLNMKMLVVGGNFSFGREKVHTEAALEAISDDLGFDVKIVRPLRHNSRTISSSLIRHLIENGKLRAAAKLLGRPVSILGTVVKGRQRGRTIGFKTANIDPHHEAIPPSGVYSAYSKLGSKRYKSVLNIGIRPTFKEKEPTIEVHLFGIDRRLYGRDIEICFGKRLRSERRFRNKDHLRTQILKDATLAKETLRDVP
ncbi:MAG: bifunctional riboflavin kinase/FAD synthetase [Candidatus Omnitrophica bacterium]|nr:bifunctional riboflavin kinase/FAD synthetase [Candidatus Omnitrophota bacterium]